MKKIFFILLLLRQFSFASSSVGVTQTSATGSQTQGVSGTYEEESKNKEKTIWSLTGDLAQTQTTSTNETDTSIDSDWETSSRWTIGVGYDFSNDTVNKITGTQPFFKLEKKFVYGKVKPSSPKVQTDEASDEESADKKEEFTPYFKIKSKFARNIISQTIATKLRPTKFEAVQVWSQLGFQWRFIEKLSLEAYYKKYSYDKDMTLLLKQLDNPLAPRPILAKALTSTLSSFYNYEYSYGFTIYPWDFLDIEIIQTKNESLSTLAIATDNAIALTFYIYDNWQIEVGASQTTYSDTTPSSTSATGTLTYNF